VKGAKREGRKVVWDRTTKKLPSLPTENRLSSSSGVASANAPLIKKRGARRHGLASPPLCDHAALLHLIGTRSRAERTEHDDVATGDTVEALIDALLQIGDSPGCGSAASLGTPLGGSAEKATNDEPKREDGDGEVLDEKKQKKDESFAAGAAAACQCWEEADANRRVWEAMKKRVMHIEEYGALPPEGDDAGDAGDADSAIDPWMDYIEAERATRERRARRRRRWAEKALPGQGQAREETSRRAVKKRRRHAGCWIGENGVFARLVRKISFVVVCIYGLTRLQQYARRIV
jgi:hypothetical protein